MIQKTRLADTPLTTKSISDTPAIGIDLGTTNSAIALAEADTAELTILENGCGERTTPSRLTIKIRNPRA
ncbi:Hsp70 family protein [Saliphagus sp. LR7]|uniref:Hsp70 family protein n=1 Tax=Saliphagus sp. LR7 TaxID=2282654 RepID=UPI001E522D7C|nr:Hsp70 family protein [Saliphagus sp. LR7]